MKHLRFHTLCHLLLWGISLLGTGVLAAQSDPAPFECNGVCSDQDPVSGPDSGGDCAHTSSLWSSNARHIPRTDARPIYVRANFIVLRKSDDADPDVQGNFSEDNAEHMAYLNECVAQCNENLRALYGTSDCDNLMVEAKVQIVPNFIFLKDEYSWNNDNDPTLVKCPNNTTWYLNPLNSQIHADPNTLKGINVYLTNQGDIYNKLVTLGTIDHPELEPNYCRWWYSEWPSSSNLQRSSRIHLPNMYLKYRWFQLHPEVTGAPFSESRHWLIGDARGVLSHEFGHSFIDDYVHYDACTNHLMRTNEGHRNVIRATDVGCMHRNLAISNLRQFVDCTETYNMPESNASDRIVNTSEKWDLNMRLYTNVVVKAGATLTLTCETLMPYQGNITVERGAKLIVDGGIVRRANTCTPAQFWRGVIAQGNNTLPQPSPSGPQSPDQASVVLLHGQGMIEGAGIGVAAKGHSLWDVPQFRGALIQATDFTFRDCRKGVEFMKYDLVNFSKFDNVLFENTATGTMQTGVSIWDTDGILFERCTFKNMALNGIRTWDAVFNVKQKNRFYGSEVAILAEASAPLNGQIQVGVLGLTGNDRNKFENNVVGIRATANTKVEIFSNDFDNFNFDVAINGTTQSALTDNSFASSTAGNQFENTGNNSNQNLCNRYQGNIVGTNIVGKNAGFLFRQEDFATDFHDLFIEGTQANLGEIQMFQGIPGGARWNYFSANKPENIKTSTVLPNNNTVHFFYFHPNPNIDSRLKPLCSLNDACVPHSNFTNVETGGGTFDDCIYPVAPPYPCHTKPCLDAVRVQIAQKTAQYAANPTTELAAELQNLVTQGEHITSDLVRGHIALNDWAAVETLLNEDMNPANRRRMVGAKLEQKQFAAANAMLQSFPQSTLDDQYFVQVQSINSARLANPEFVLNSAQEAILLSIAESPSQEAGYAQGLLGILTGRVFMPKLPDLGGERNGQPSGKLALLSALQASPNPVSDVLQVQVPQRTDQSVSQTLELRDMATGILVQSVRVPDGNAVTISVQALPSGLYLLTLQEQGIAVARQKITIQH